VKIACIEPEFLDGLQKIDLQQQSGQNQLVKKEKWQVTGEYGKRSVRVIKFQLGFFKEWRIDINLDRIFLGRYRRIFSMGRFLIKFILSSYWSNLI
jgi:hypothetical protein